MEFYQSIWTGTFCYNARTTLYRDGLVEGSRWTTVINSSDITRPAAAQALITGHDVVRTKYVHQVTTCCLEEILQTQGSSGASFLGKHT